MKKTKKIKIKSERIKPKTPEQKAELQDRLDDAFAILFNEVEKELKKEHDNTKSKRNSR